MRGPRVRPGVTLEVATEEGERVLDSVMDMSSTTAVVIGLVLLLMIVVGVFMAIRILGGRAQAADNEPSRSRPRRSRTGRPDSR